MADSFLSHMDQIRQDYNNQKNLLNGIIQTSETELVQIASTVRKLEEQRIDANRRIYQANEALKGQKFDQQEETLNFNFPGI